MVTAIALEDPLHDDLPPLMLEIDINVRRFVTFLRDEALEQQVVERGVDGGDAEHVADRRVRRAATPLAENVPRAGEADDGMDGQEVRCVA